jgi:hypothetical protein
MHVYGVGIRSEVDNGPLFCCVNTRHKRHLQQQPSLVSQLDAIYTNGATYSWSTDTFATVHCALLECMQIQRKRSRCV